jgi:hypothetical protein
MCVLTVSTNFVKYFFIQRRIQRDIVTNIQKSSRKVSVILVTF